MKKTLLTSILFLSISICNAQIRTIANPKVIEGVLIKITPPLSEVISFADTTPYRDHFGVIGENKKNREHRGGGHPAVDPTAKPQGIDPALQTTYNTVRTSTSTITRNFDGIGNTGVSPADPSLCVGPNHVIQMINGSSGALFKVFDKQGNVLKNNTYVDALSSISGLGDPICMYDQMANRFFITEFSTQFQRKLIVLVSQTADPLGSWYVYSFQTPTFPDYPKWAIWPDALLCTTNETSNKVYAVDRQRMLQGQSTTTMLSFSIPRSPSVGFQAATPVNISGTNMPPTGTKPLVMRLIDDLWTSNTSDVDHLEMWELTPNFDNPSQSTLIQTQNVNTAAFNTALCGYTSMNCIPQPSGATLDPLREVIMNRIYYRNFNTWQSIVAVHAVDKNNNDVAGSRWYELRIDSTNTWNVHQQSTYSPDNTNRWMGTIAMNSEGSIGMAYNVSSSSVYPGLRYTGRNSENNTRAPLNVMNEPETTIIDGSSSSSSNRWGDYNDMQVDPADDKTFWVTGMYMGSNGWGTRIASFSIDPQIPTPLSLLTFEARRIHKGKVTISWTTTDERMLKGFEIERENTQGSFEKIGFIAANNSETGIEKYTFNDLDFNDLITKYYRLKMIDEDGKSRYSPIEFVKGSITQPFEFYPNPVINNEAYLRIKSSMANQNLSIKIYDLQGKEVYKQVNINQQQVVRLNLSKVPNGLHILHVLDENGQLLHQQKILQNN